MAVGPVLKSLSPVVIGDLLTLTGLFFAIWGAMRDSARGKEILKALDRIERLLKRKR